MLSPMNTINHIPSLPRQFVVEGSALKSKQRPGRVVEERKKGCSRTKFVCWCRTQERVAQRGMSVHVEELIHLVESQETERVRERERERRLGYYRRRRARNSETTACGGREWRRFEGEEGGQESRCWLARHGGVETGRNPLRCHEDRQRCAATT
jgi:hypothetical protein